MDENTKVKVEEKIKELMALAKKKKNVLEYQEITDCFAGLGLEVEQIEKTVEALERSGIDVLRITEEEVLPVEDDDIILTEEDEVDVENIDLSVPEGISIEDPVRMYWNIRRLQTVLQVWAWKESR